MPLKKNKILFLVQLPPPIHGVSTMNENLVKSKLISDEFDTKVITLRFTNHIEEVGKASSMKLMWMLLIVFQIIKTCFFFRPKAVYFTISHIGFAFYRDVLYVVILKMFRIKRIYHLHGKGIKENVDKNKINKLLYQFVFRNSYVICLSSTLTEDINLFNVKKIFTVNNGIEVIDFIERIEQGEKVQLLFLSNLGVEKGLFDFLDTLRYLKDMQSLFYVTIIGKPFDINENQLSEYIVLNNLTNISYEGAKYGKEKYDYLKKASILIFPTRNDAFPLVIIEAMQFGIPVISTFEGGIPDIIDNNINGFLIPKNKAELIAEKVRFLLNNPIQRIKMGQNAKNKFQNRYTLDIFESNMRNVFYEILTEN